jgi:hypothetical protein
LERASLDLDSRIRRAQKLNDFEFPSIFAGIANSTSSSASKIVRFASWKNSFLALRKFTIAYLKDKHGSWPPKASNKKNDFEESGLNRLVVQRLYDDFADLYDFLVDRTNLTTRSIDIDTQDDDIDNLVEGDELTSRVLRSMLSEYDRSAPPVLPPIPFDLPRLPSLASINPALVHQDPQKEAKERKKKLRKEELAHILDGSHNTEVRVNSFSKAFLSFEYKQATGKTISELSDQRCGYWIFLYAVLQSLPLLTVDAPNLTYTEGVEYFLCEPPKGGAPWRPADATRKSWYGVAGGTGVVSLPSDLIEYGIEAIYSHSRCWLMAQQLTAQYGGAQASAPPGQFNEPILAPPGMPSANTLVPWNFNSNSSRSSVVLGLEALPVPENIGLGRASPEMRPASRHNPNASFDNILSLPEHISGKKK